METAQTAEKALLALIHVEQNGPSAISDIAAAIETSKSVAHRLVTTLHRRSLLRHLPDGTYGLGPGLIAVAEHLPDNLVRVATPHLDALAAAVRETVVLAVRDRAESVVVAKANSHAQQLRIEYELGFRHPLGSGASGLAILSALPETERSAFAPEIDSHQWVTMNAQGYALSTGAVRADMVGIAVPLAPTSAIRASLAVVFPSARDHRVEEIVPLLKRTAHEIEAELN